MATVRWLGTATAVNQVSTATPANVEIGDVFNLLVGGVTIATFTASAATVANVTAGLTTAWNASSHPYATGITASDQTTHVALTADSAGVPFTVTATATDGGGANTQTLTMATTTANAGPNVWTTASNWSGGSVPVNSDVVIFENNAVPVYWGIDQNAVTLAELRILQSYTGEIGLPETKFLTSTTGNFANYDASKTEYRETYLKIGATLLNIGQSVGYVAQAGSPRIKVNLGSVQTTATIYDSCTSSSDAPLQPVRILGTHASNVVNVLRGTVGIATSLGSEVSTVATLNMRYVSGQDTDANVTLGPGVTWSTINKTGGTLAVNSVNTGGDGLLNVAGVANVAAGSGTVSAVQTQGGSVTLDGGFALTTLNAYGGTTYSNTSGTITTIYFDDGGVVDMSGSAVSRTVTNISVRPGGGTLIADLSRVSMPNGIQYDNSGTIISMKAVFTPQ